MNAPRFSKWLIIAISLAFTFAPVASQAELGDPSGMAMIADGIVARPAGAAVTVVGLAAYVVTLPFSAISKSSKSAWRTLVSKPANFTFKRRLGIYEDGSY
jgi:hypothetical protein